MLPHGCANTLTDLRGFTALAAAVVDLQRFERCSGVSRLAGLHTVETNLGPSASISIDAEAIAPLESR